MMMEVALEIFKIPSAKALADSDWAEVIDP
jgi:hypothetical protein